MARDKADLEAKKENAPFLGDEDADKSKSI